MTTSGTLVISNTDPDGSVTALSLSGSGALSFNHSADTTLTGLSTALREDAFADDGTTPGSISMDTGASLNGGSNAIVSQLRPAATGGIDITTRGGGISGGIRANVGAGSAGGISITTIGDNIKGGTSFGTMDPAIIALADSRATGGIAISTTGGDIIGYIRAISGSGGIDVNMRADSLVGDITTTAQAETTGDISIVTGAGVIDGSISSTLEYVNFNVGLATGDITITNNSVNLTGDVVATHTGNGKIEITTGSGTIGRNVLADGGNGIAWVKLTLL